MANPTQKYVLSPLIFSARLGLFGRPPLCCLDLRLHFFQDFIDIFTTLMISLPLKSHRVRFKTYPFTFTTEEALQNMASLRLTQTNRMDDPKVPRADP
jgi:hypothetical protein